MDPENTTDGVKIVPCDVCGANDAEEIVVAREYMTGPMHVCRNCGLCYIRERRSTFDVAEGWTRSYTGPYNQYSAAVAAQHAFIARYLELTVGLRGSRVVDIGAGEGKLGELLDSKGAITWSVEPSPFNCAFNKSNHVHMGTIEDFQGLEGLFDICVMNFTLECTADPRGMLARCHALLKPGGVALVCTGSRVMAPLTRPLWQYLSKQPPDEHPLRFTPISLENIFKVSAFEPVKNATYADLGLLMQVGRRAEKPIHTLTREKYEDVIAFFEHWHRASTAREPDTGHAGGPVADIQGAPV